MTKKPNIKDFADALKQTGGNLTQTAALLNVGRTAIHRWVAEDPQFKEALNDARGKMLDECIAVSRIVALGIPDKDPTGKMIGWIERPDSSMLRYLLGTLGRKEGFGENIEVKADVEMRGSIPVSEWVKDRLKKK